MEQILLAGIGGIISGVLLSGCFYFIREALKRQKAAAEKAGRMIMEIEGLLQGRR